MISKKLEIFRGTLDEMLNNHYHDYRIKQYINGLGSISWLDVIDKDANLKIAEVIAVESFGSYDTCDNSLLVIDYVNSDSRRFDDTNNALLFMKSILTIASERKKARAADLAIEATDLNENQIHLESLRDDEIKTATIDPTKYYLVTGRGNGKTLFYQNVLKYLFGFKIKDVIFNDPATIVFWEDGGKTVVQCQHGEEFDPEKGLAMAISKKIYGNKHAYYDVFKKFVGKYNKKKLRESKQVQTKEETVVASLTLSEVSLSPEDAAQVIRVNGETETKNPREGRDFNDYLNEQLKDPEFKKQYENTEILKPYCDTSKENDNE